MIYGLERNIKECFGLDGKDPIIRILAQTFTACRRLIRLNEFDMVKVDVDLVERLTLALKRWKEATDHFLALTITHTDERRAECLLAPLLADCVRLWGRPRKYDPESFVYQVYRKIVVNDALRFPDKAYALKHLHSMMWADVMMLVDWIDLMLIFLPKLGQEDPVFEGFCRRCFRYQAIYELGWIVIPNDPEGMWRILNYKVSNQIATDAVEMGNYYHRYREQHPDVLPAKIKFLSHEYCTLIQLSPNKMETYMQLIHL